jgi:hypothetical protein
MKLKIVPHVNEALKTYASAIGEQYFEAEHAPIQANKTLIEQAKDVVKEN